METGDRNVSLNRLRRFASALDCRVEDLLPAEIPNGADELLAVYGRLSPEDRELLRLIANRMAAS